MDILRHGKRMTVKFIGVTWTIHKTNNPAIGFKLHTNHILPDDFQKLIKSVFERTVSFQSMAVKQ